MGAILSLPKRWPLRSIKSQGHNLTFRYSQQYCIHPRLWHWHASKVVICALMCCITPQISLVPRGYLAFYLTVTRVVLWSNSNHNQNISKLVKQRMQQVWWWETIVHFQDHRRWSSGLKDCESIRFLDMNWNAIALQCFKHQALSRIA